VKRRPDERAGFVQIYLPMAQNLSDDVFLVVRPKAGPAEALTSGVRGAISRVDREQLVSVRDVRTLEDIERVVTSRHRFRAFLAACETHRFRPGEGLPGRVWATAEAAWLDDVVRDANFPRMAVALQHGLRSAVAFPVRCGGDVVGVVELFSEDIVIPDDDLLSTLDTVGRVLGLGPHASA
jgi:hypothetical protein